MAEGESFDRWLNDFSSEVDAALQKSGDAAAATPQARHARDAFDRWWQSEQKSPVEPSIRFDDAPAAQTGPVPVKTEEWPARVERLADDRARLQQERDAARQESRELNDRLSTVQSQIAEFEARLSKSRRSYEDHIESLERKVAELEGQAERQREAAAASRRGDDEQKAALEQAALDRQRADAAERQLLDARQRLVELERQLAQARQDAAAHAAVVEELRRQASTYQLRLVQSKEATDTDVTTMRQELKTFLEDLRLIRNTMRKGT